MISLLRARPRISAAGPFRLTVGGTIAVLLVAACSSGGGFSPAIPASAAGSSSTPALAAPSGGASTPALAAPSASPTASRSDTPVPANAIVVHVKDFTLDPAAIVHTGRSVTFDVINDGPTPHNLTVRTASGTVLFATRDLRAGESQVITATLPATGTYITFCSLPGHESLGIRGTLAIR